MIAILILVFFGLLLLFAGIFQMNKILMPLSAIALIAALVCCFQSGDGAAFEAYKNMFLFTTYARAFSALLIFTTLLIVILGPYFLNEDMHYKGDKYALLLFSLSGAITMVAAQNLLMLFLGIEILSIPLYILAASQKDDLHSNEAGMKYFLMGSFATGILLFGMALIYGATGTTEINVIWATILTNGFNQHLMLLGVFLILIALLFKVGAVPFHFWVPDVYDGTPTLFTLFMSTVVKTAAFSVLFKLFAFSFNGMSHDWKLIVALVSAATMLLANITAIYQVSFKRMMAYSSISHVGYLMMALLFIKVMPAQSAILLYLTAYSIASVSAFAIFILVQKQSNSSNFDAFEGLGKRNPMLAVAMTIAMFSLAGIPLTAGFFGKYYIFSVAFTQYKPLVIIAILNSAISIYYYFKVVVNMWFRENEKHYEVVEMNPLYTAVITLTSIAIIVLGILPNLIIEMFW
ncbi:MAG: NADH-quinone oxidoreductase subunit N [Bacteroidota bacterium]